MTEAAKLRWNTVPMWALLLAIVGLLTNVAFFVSVPLQSALPWVSLTLAVVALIVMVTGVRRAIVQSQVYRGKVLSIVLAVVTLTVAGLNIFGFFGARALPGAAAAPQVGQQARTSPWWTASACPLRSTVFSCPHRVPPHRTRPKRFC